MMSKTLNKGSVRRASKVYCTVQKSRLRAKLGSTQEAETGGLL